MKCFNHPNVDAVGYCTNCGKSVCNDCAMTVGGNLTCKSCFANMSSGTAGTPAAAPVAPAAQAPPVAPPVAAPVAPPVPPVITQVPPVITQVPPVITQVPIIPPVPPVSNPAASAPTPGPNYNFSPAAAAPARKEPILSLILSGIGFVLFGIIGLGQIYNGQIKKGVILSAGNWVLWFVVIVVYMIGSLVTLGIGGLCCLPVFIVPVILWFYAMYDAYVTADKLNKGEYVKDWLS